MDIEKIIEELRAERERLDETIVAIERLRFSEFAPAAKRRGRKFMDKNGRKEVSARMKRYWAARRKEKAAQSKEATWNEKETSAGTGPGATSAAPESDSIAA